MNASEIAAALAQPFALSELEWRVGSTNKDKTKGLALVYVTNRAIMHRLDQVVGIDGWKNEYVAWRAKGVLCQLSLRINGEWIAKCDGADESDIEATKGGFSDAMKRTAVQWGIGRYLYELPDFWAPLEGGKYLPRDFKPAIPAQYLPGGTRTHTATPPPSQSEAGKGQDSKRSKATPSGGGGLLIPEAQLPPWIDEKVGYGKKVIHACKVADQTWRWMISGAKTGGRVSWMRESVKWASEHPEASDAFKETATKAAELLFVIGSEETPHAP